MISILNYGLGNVSAFERSLQRSNIPYQLASTPSDLKTASKIIFPGVGSFDQTITLLQDKGLFEPLNLLVTQSQIPILGICVGMQVMGSSSTEGSLSGFGWVDGIVEHLHTSTPESPLPHIGWNTINSSHSSSSTKESTSEFYFLHSYGFRELSPIFNPLYTTYVNSFVASFAFKNIFGVQFHPEKSHQSGQLLLQNFCLSGSLSL